MLYWSSLVFQSLCWIAPILALIIDARAWTKRSAAKGSGLGLSSILAAGLIIGVGGSLAYANLVGGRVSFAQMALAAYIATAFMIILRWIDAGMFWILRGIWNRIVPPTPQLSFSKRALDSFPALLRVVLLFALGIPYITAGILVYRPHLKPLSDPRRALGVPFETISFQTSDHVTISGWWIPAPRNAREETIVLCHGMGADKSRMLSVAGQFVAAGYHVLNFDFRAHGQSDGIFTSLGMHEQRDVLAAVRWLRDTHPLQSTRVLGVGIDTGAAALLGAATDAGVGQSIDALAIYSGFANVHEFANEAAFSRLLPPWDWLEKHVALPIANVIVGADLARFTPQEFAAQFWPRPLLVIHGQTDPVVPFSQGQALFNHASEPKKRLWLDARTPSRFIDDPAVAQQVLQFFQNAQPVPLI